MLKFTPGKEYEVVSVSFNPDETPKDAASAKQTYVARINEHLNPKTNGDGWHFLAGQQPQIKELADAVGFHYRRDPQTKQFIHATAIMIVTPSGKLAQYYYGVEFSPKDIRLGLIEAARGNIGNVVDEVLLYCYHYDPKTGRYGAVVTNIMRLAGAATVLILGGFLIVMFRRDRPGPPTRNALSRVGVAGSHGSKKETGRAGSICGRTSHSFLSVPRHWHGRWTDFIFC
jgi:protein SCO1/2